jgi:tetratricopeptide (TPR) repeat protein
LEEGRLWAHLTTDQPHEFRVETPSAVAAVRDTHFSVEVGEDQRTRVSVAEGEVEVTAQGESVTVVAGQQTIVEPGQPPGPPEPMSDEERELWGLEDETEPKIVFPENGQIVWGTINVLVSLPSVEVSEVVFAYDGGEGFVDFGADDGSTVDSDFVRQDRFGTWDTSELPTGDYALQARVEGADGQVVMPEITVTVVDEPQVDIEWSVIESNEEVTRVLLSASESSNPDLYQLSYTWVFADGSTSDGGAIEREFAGHPVCHQSIQDDYQMLYELAPEEMDELKPLVEETTAGPCVEPVVLSHSSPGGMWGEEAMLLSIEPVLTAEVAYAGASPLSAPSISVSKAHAHDAHRINKLSMETSRTMATLLRAYKAGGLTEKQKSDLWTAVEQVLVADVNLVLAKTSLKLDRLPEAISELADARKALRVASKLVRTINVVRGEADKLDLVSAGASAAWGRLRLVQLIGDEPEDLTSPTVAKSLQYEIGGGWTERTGSCYALGSRRSETYCTQFLVIQSSDRHDDDVILHEFGHHVMYKMMNVGLPGGPHSFGKKCTEPLAWSEGWAHFVQAVLQKDSIFKDVETGGNIECDLEKDPKGYANSKRGPDEEGSVAAILWDLYDGSDGVKDKDKDGVSIEFKYIWEAMKNSKTTEEVGDGTSIGVGAIKPLAFENVGTIKRFYEELIKIINANEKLKKDINKGKIRAIFREHNVPVVAPPAPGRPTITPTLLPRDEVWYPATVTPEPPTQEEEEAVQGVTDQVITPTPAVTPTVTPTPGPAAEDYAAEGLDLFEKGCRQLKEHVECTEGIKSLQRAIELFNAAVKLDPNLAAGYFGRGMSLSCLEERFDEAVQDLELALNLGGLGPDQIAQAEQELEAMKKKLAASGCVSIESVAIGEGLTADGQLIGQRDEFSADIPMVTAQWQMIASCNPDVTIKWKLNYELNCQHPDTIEKGSTSTASNFFPDDEEDFLGDVVCASIWGAGYIVPDSEVCANFFEPPTPLPSSDAQEGAPKILSIEFPSQITADDTPFYGSVWFEDQEGDITEFRLDPTTAIDFPFIAFNPMDYVVEGDSYKGRFDFNLYCTIAQDVKMRATLKDNADNKSPPKDFSFSCR